MTLKEAEKFLQQDLDHPLSVDIYDLNKAKALGIEALKREQRNRARFRNAEPELLPGETEE